MFQSVCTFSVHSNTKHVQLLYATLLAPTPHSSYLFSQNTTESCVTLGFSVPCFLLLLCFSRLRSADVLRDTSLADRAGGSPSPHIIAPHCAHPDPRLTGELIILRPETSALALCAILSPQEFKQTKPSQARPLAV